MKSKGHLYFRGFLILVSGYAILTASRWSFKTGFFPLAIAIPLLLLVFMHLYLEFFRAPEIGKGPAVDADFSGDVDENVARRRIIITFSWIAGFILAVYLIGFPSTVPLFMFFYLKLDRKSTRLNSSHSQISYAVFC